MQTAFALLFTSTSLTSPRFFLPISARVGGTDCSSAKSTCLQVALVTARTLPSTLPMVAVTQVMVLRSCSASATNFSTSFSILSADNRRNMPCSFGTRSRTRGARQRLAVSKWTNRCSNCDSTSCPEVDEIESSLSSKAAVTASITAVRALFVRSLAAKLACRSPYRLGSLARSSRIH